MGLLANFKIRTKVLVASLPLVLMVLLAALYASLEMYRIDIRYSELIGRDVKALHDLTIARVMGNHQLLAVIELAPAAPVSERQQALLDLLLPTVALNTKIQASKLETRKLLAQTQVQAADLQERDGIVANVVFPTGIDRRDDLGTPDRFDVYYGMVDNRIRAARLDLPDHLPVGVDADSLQAKV